MRCVAKAQPAGTKWPSCRFQPRCFGFGCLGGFLHDPTAFTALFRICSEGYNRNRSVKLHNTAQQTSDSNQLPICTESGFNRNLLLEIAFVIKLILKVIITILLIRMNKIISFSVFQSVFTCVNIATLSNHKSITNTYKPNAMDMLSNGCYKCTMQMEWMSLVASLSVVVLVRRQ